MQCAQAFVGVDVSKSKLNTFMLGGSGNEIANEATAIRAWLSSLPEGSAIAVESTGRYHRLLVELSHASGRPAFVLNASDVYFYAKALGARGKTDRLDAQVIARYLAERHADLKPWAPSPEWTTRLQELLRTRAGVAEKRASLRQLLRDVSELAAEAKGLDKYLESLIERIDTRIAAVIEQDKKLAERHDTLRTIPGVGPQAAAMLTAIFSRIEFATSDAVVAYSGLDPRPDDSGTKVGKRRLSKRGPPELRRQMYLVALAAGHSKALRELDAKIKAKGFKPTQALVILARKLLRVAWAVWKQGKPFDAALLQGKTACPKT